MPTYVCSWKIFDSMRKDCMTFFSTMTPQDDLADMGKGVKLIGRWHDTGASRGWLVAEANDLPTLHAWIYNWVPMCDCKTEVVLGDDAHRAIILKRLGKPAATWKAAEGRATNAEPQKGENLYWITYKFKPGMVMKGFGAFGGMTAEMDKKDPASCVPMGRWHNAGTGSGYAVCAASSVADLYAWTLNWAELCDCDVVPVLTDKQARTIVQNKPDFKQSAQMVLNKFHMLGGGAKTVADAMSKLGL